MPAVHQPVIPHGPAYMQSSMVQPTNQHDQHPPAVTQQQPAGLPAEWVPTAEFYDSRDIYGRKFYREVQSSAFTRKLGVNGMDPLKVTVAQLAYKGNQELSLRYLPNGMFVGTVFTRSISESVFCSFLLTRLRELGVEIDEVIGALWEESGNVQPDRKEKPKENIAPLVNLLADVMKSHMPAKTQAAAFSKIQELQDVIARLQAAKEHASPEKRPQTTTPVPSSVFTQPKSLSKDQLPRSMSTQDFKAWKNRLNASQLEKLDRFTSEIQEAWKAIPKEDSITWQDVAAKWGLPFNLIQSASSQKKLQDFVAAAALMTA